MGVVCCLSHFLPAASLFSNYSNSICVEEVFGQETVTAVWRGNVFPTKPLKLPVPLKIIMKGKGMKTKGTRCYMLMMFQSNKFFNSIGRLHATFFANDTNSCSFVVAQDNALKELV